MDVDEKTPAEMARGATAEIQRKLEELALRKRPDFSSPDFVQKFFLTEVLPQTPPSGNAGGE